MGYAKRSIQCLTGTVTVTTGSGSTSTQVSPLDATPSHVHVVETSSCEEHVPGPRPHAAERCISPPCPSPINGSSQSPTASYFWTSSDQWSACSAPCMSAGDIEAERLGMIASGGKSLRLGVSVREAPVCMTLSSITPTSPAGSTEPQAVSSDICIAAGLVRSSSTWRHLPKTVA